MTKEKAQQVLDEMQGVRPEMLNGEAKRLFEAIIKMADERDRIKQKYDRDTHILQNQLDLSNAKNIEKDKQIEKYINMLATNDMLHVLEYEEKDKIIDIMAEQINNYDIDEDVCKQMGQKEDCNEFEDKEKCKECIKQYFRNKSKETK